MNTSEENNSEMSGGADMHDNENEILDAIKKEL